jgi:hypothetical protein
VVLSVLTGMHSSCNLVVIKSLCAPDDYSTKTRKLFLTVLITYHDNVVIIRDSR